MWMYSWPLNNTGLRCKGPLISRYFSIYSQPSLYLNLEPADTEGQYGTWVSSDFGICWGGTWKQFPVDTKGLLCYLEKGLYYYLLLVSLDPVICVIIGSGVPQCSSLKLLKNIDKSFKSWFLNSPIDSKNELIIINLYYHGEPQVMK